MESVAYKIYKEMLIQCSICIMPKSTFQHKTFCNKLYGNIVRSFYNDKTAINDLLQYVRTRQINTPSKYDKKEENNSTSLFDFYTNTEAPEMHHFRTFNLKLWWKHQTMEFRKFYQEQLYKSNELLGPDLAAAKFILNNGGRIKFIHDDWMNAKEISKLPTKYFPNFILESIDLMGYPLEFENLDVISNVSSLKWLSLRGCSTINDWSLDRLAGQYPMLKYFDISECENVTERGIEALYKMPNLKELIVTNFHGTAAFELTCLMLEDINPYLKCRVLNPKKKLLSIKGNVQET